jgi:protein-L-isoaspartate(D-aspartate) O-methyltransferase
MTDFATARRMMVDGQVRTNDVTDLRIIAAMMEIPRERFVPPALADLAYLDRDLPIGPEGGGRRLLKPMVLAKMVQLADVGEADRVLVVGCATGYSAAVLSRLAGDVAALEEEPVLVREAARVCGDLGCANVRVVQGPLTAGWPADAPYDVIFLDGATEVAPATLANQLGEGGRMVAVVGKGPIRQAKLYRKVGGVVSDRSAFDALASVLPGFQAPAEFVF